MTINYIIITGISAWALSQVSKVCIGLFRYGTVDSSRSMWRLIWASGMPSSHSAMSASALTIIGIKEGLESPIFGLCFILTSIVIYDRSRAYKILCTFEKTVPILKDAIKKNPTLKESVGHDLPEIFAGCMIGVGVALVISVLII